MGSFQTFPMIGSTASGPSAAFSAITSGTNISANMQVGSGAMLTPVNTGVISANQLQSIPVTTNAPTDSYALAYVAANTDLEFLPLPVTIAAVSSNFLTSYTSTTGVFTAAQPAFTDIAGTATSGQYVVMVGDSGSGGVQGAVPAPPAGSAAAGDFLRADGTWAVPASSGGVTVAGTIDLTAQAAALTAQTFGVTPGANGPYRVSVYAQLTQQATVSSTLGNFTVNFTDGTSIGAAQSIAIFGQTQSAGNQTDFTGNSTSDIFMGSIIIYAKSGVPITLSVGYASSGATPMQYAIHAICEQL